jgi:acetylornithine aminotransferase
VVLILDEVQSGFGRMGSFAINIMISNQNIICMAKGMGTVFQLWYFNAPSFEASYGLLELLLESHLALCREVLPFWKNLMENAKKVEGYFMEAIKMQIIKVKEED